MDFFNRAGRGNYLGDLVQSIGNAQKSEQLQSLQSGAVEGGIGSQEFKNLAAFSPEQATKLKSLLATDDQGLNAAFEDASVFKNLLQNDPSGQSAMNFGMQRMQMGQSQGRDMIHTQRFLEEIQANPSDALNSIGSFLDIPNQLGGSKPISVQSSKILDDGTIISVLKGGGRQVTSPTGELLKGEAARDSVARSRDQAHKRQIELKRLDQTIKRTEQKEGLLNDQQKSIQRSNIRRLGELSGTSSGRNSAVKKATKFKVALESGNVHSGAGRKGLSFVPGVFTSQGQFDEEFNAFSEVAARQTLKASGETRPTDADVQGMKQAMFGIGRDESVNIQLLTDFLADQHSQTNELDQLINATSDGNLSEFTFTPKGAINKDNPATFKSGALGRDISEQDITDTLQANPGVTREQLFKQLGIN